MVDETGELPAVDLELGSTIPATAALLLTRLRLPADTELRLHDVLTGASWWEDHPEIGPLQPLWVVLEVDHRGSPPAPTRPIAELPLATGSSPRSGEPGSTAPTHPTPTGGDYIRRLRPRIGTARIFYPWAGLALRDDADRVFLVRLAEGEQWHCPGGGLEIGETPAEAARRELEEETGLLARAERIVGCYSRHQRSFANGDRIQAVAVLFEGSITGGALRRDTTDEIDAAGWYGLGALPLLRRPWDERVRLLLTGAGDRLD